MPPHRRFPAAGKKILLKLIGVLLFVWILQRVDIEALVTELLRTDALLLAASFGVMIASYAVKALRWHILSLYAGATVGIAESWKNYNIGIFLGTITPAKVGEFGRIGHLRRAGLNMKRAVSIALLDRIADTVVILSMAPMAILIFTEQSHTIRILAASLFILGTLCIVVHFAFRSRRLLSWIGRITQIPIGLLASQTLLLSFLAWTLYFFWAILIARSVGIDLPAPVLIAAFTVAGILSLMPIAPAGLGTRDAALLALLLPYGISTPQIVSLSLLMFVSILLGSMIGACYFFRRDLVTV